MVVLRIANVAMICQTCQHKASRSMESEERVYGEVKGNIFNRVETFMTFDALDNVLSGYGPGYDALSVGAPLASCSSAFVGGVGDSLDKCKLQTSGNSDVFEAYLALCSSGAGSRRSRSLSQTTPVSNSNLVHTDFSSVCGPSASLLGRSFHAYPNAVMITADSQHSYPVSRDGGNTQENCQLRSTIGVNNNGSSASRRDRNLQVRPRLNSAVSVRSTSMRTRRRVLTSGSTVDSNSVASAGTSYTYSDLGDCDRRCRYCGASFWYVERLKRHLHNQTPEYHLCCGGGEPPRFLQLYIYNTDNELQNKMHHFGGIDNSQLEPGIVEGLIHFLDAHNELVQLFRTARDKCRELDIPEFKIRLYNAEGARDYELPTSNTWGKRLTMLAYYRYQLHFRLQQYDLLFRGGRLFQQYVVGVFCAVEQNRLDYIRKKQNDIRSDYLSGLYDAISRGERDGYEVGGRIILPIALYSRIPKRGLPHYHTLLWVDSASRIRIAEDVDRFISAELPYPRIDPEGYNVVSELMMHGPCGAASLKAPCMKGDKCSKKFPKKFNQKTFFDENGHVHYRRKDTSVSVTRNEFQLDNSYVVPYNRDLLLAFRAHVNVEYCRWSMLIKYLFKYISKGTDIVFVRVSRPIGESSTVATPLRQFDIHHREPAVQILAVHLEDMQRITFRYQDRLKSVIDLPRKKSTTLTEWFAFNKANEVGRHLSYLEFPSEFVWYSDRKSWSPRKTNKSSIGRLAYVHPTSGELFFLRMLLCHQKGCRDFWEVQTVNGVFYPTYRAACQALGLLGDDKEWEIAFEEACGSATPEELRFLFSHILLYCDVADPSRLWRKYWKEMSYDIPKKVSEKVQIPDYHLNDDLLQGYTLYEIEIILSNCGKSLHAFGLPPPPQDLLAQLANRLLMEERNYNREELAQLKDESSYLFMAMVELAKHFSRKPSLVAYVLKERLYWQSHPQNTQLGKLLADTDLIIWDESPMNDRRCFEALDRSLRDIVDKPSSLFGGKSVLLGDYIGCLRSTGSISDFGDPNRRQSVRRKIEIENLNGNIVECTLWDEMAEHFGEADLASMKQPVIIAISSCRVSKHTDYQLSASSATYYYLNPKIPEAEESRDLFKARYEDTPPLTIYKYPHKDIQQDKTRNRFTTEATITGINMNKDWYYISCHQCGRAAIVHVDNYSCLDHGPQPGPFFRYKFKGYITNNIATTPITFFTPVANKVTDYSCTELVQKYKPADPTKIPQEILAAQGKHGVFQFHFNTLGNLADLSLDAVYDVKKQDHSTSSGTQEINKGTPSSVSAATNQPTEEEENTQKDKQKDTAGEGGAAKNNEESDRQRGTSAKRALFDQQSTDSKKHKED
ncbi:DNA helicase [Tanacetum coccineum]